MSASGCTSSSEEEFKDTREIDGASEPQKDETEETSEEQQVGDKEVSVLHNPCEVVVVFNGESRLEKHGSSSSLKGPGSTSSSSGGRKVSFPKDTELVTGYLEPMNPWAEVNPVTNKQLTELYLESCEKHNTSPKEVILKHLEELQMGVEAREAVLELRGVEMSHADCETLEEILKRVQYKSINLSSCNLDDISATAIFDMVEYYEATSELDISNNREIRNRGWQSCISMLRRSQDLRVLAAQGTPLSELNATNLGKALTGSQLQTLKLEHCGMTGRPIACLCTALKKSTVLKELWLADNDLNSFDAYNIAMLLKANLYIQFLHISNNNIKDEGISYLSDAIIEQTRLIKEPHSEKSARMDYSELSASLNYLNNNKCLSPSFKKPDRPPFDEVEKAAEKAKIHLLGQNNGLNNNEAAEEEGKKPTEESTEVAEEPRPAEKEGEGTELNANDPPKDASPLNLKSLKEELELLEPVPEKVVVEEAPEKPEQAESAPLAVPEKTKEATPVPEVSKSLDTDSGSDFGEDKPTPLLMPPVVGRSFSSESLNSLTSIDSNDSKSSIRITEAKFAKNGTLERQHTVTTLDEPATTPTGVQVLVLWNNKVTKSSSKAVADMISGTATLEVLNVGRNNLGNDFIAGIKTSLKVNTSLHTLGLQGTHLSCPGVATLAEIIQFGGNSTLQRIDLRDNNIQQDGLEALNDALKSNKSITQLDLDDTPRKLSETVDSTVFHRLTNNIKALCDRNATPAPPVAAATPSISPPPELPMPVRTSPATLPSPLVTTVKRNSRKISLTCPQNVARTSSPPLISHPSSVTTIKSPPAIHLASVLCAASAPSSVVVKSHSKSKSSKSKSKCIDSKHRLKSPLPSPIVSPLPSPSRNRFQVSKVQDSGLSPLSAGSLSTGSSPTFFPASTTSRFSVTRVVLPPAKATSTCSLLDSALSSSVESPDSLASTDVKRGFTMNDSCSSLDSNNDLNVSMSSTDSFDFILRDVPPVEMGPLQYRKPADPPSSAPTYRLNDSLSSLEVSASSQESLEYVEVRESPTKVSSSNEGTLTNSPCDQASTPVKSSSSRSRKNSWIPNPMMPKSDSGYPATLDKLFSLFQHPSAIFQRSSPDSSASQTAPPVRKDSSMGGLFAWATGTRDATEGPRVLQMTQSAPETAALEEVPAADLSNRLKTEVKENISPENTITATSVSSIKQQVLPEKSSGVIFELGDDEEEEEEEPPALRATIAAAIQQAAGNNSTSEGVAELRNEPKKGGLGQIARDSLSILKGGVNTSQDSMRSLDSLPEFELATSALLVAPQDDDVFLETKELPVCGTPGGQSPVDDTVSEAVSTEISVDPSTVVE